MVGEKMTGEEKAEVKVDVKIGATVPRHKGKELGEGKLLPQELDRTTLGAVIRRSLQQTITRPSKVRGRDSPYSLRTS
jgi:hypothetical protein